MFNVNVIQAEYGDCVLIQLGDKISDSSYILVDGGPSSVYRQQLKPTLQEECKNKILDLVVCSHIDIDHIGGLLGLFLDLNSNDSNIDNNLSVKNLWHNSFQNLLSARSVDVTKVREFLASVESGRFTDFEKPGNLSVMKAVGEGMELGELAQQLSIPVNDEFKGELIVINGRKNPIKIGSANLYILGPTQKNVKRLRKLWNEWVRKRSEREVDFSQHEKLVAIDSSVSNLSSIMFLIEYNGRRAIFTGDGLGSDVIETLEIEGLLNNEGNIHVDLLKVPHHGSERNVSKTFFDSVTADKYVISANDRDDNPSASTLEWIIESARNREIKPEILLTNRTSNTEKVSQEYNEERYNYQFRFLQNNDNYMRIELD